MFRVLPIRFGFNIFIIFSVYISVLLILNFIGHLPPEFVKNTQCSMMRYQKKWVDPELYQSNVQKVKNLKEVPRFGLFLDAPTLLLQLIITFCGSQFRKGNLANKLERASHLSKDVGEFTAALGAILVFNMPFNEAAISLAFGGVFLSYFWGHFFGIILITIANYLKTQEEKSTP